MISSAIWNKEARVNFSKTNKIAQPVNVNIHEKNARWLSRRNARVSRNQGKIAPSRVRAESKRFDWSWPIITQNFDV